jgi:hypothetical protein
VGVWSSTKSRNDRNANDIAGMICPTHSIVDVWNRAVESSSRFFMEDRNIQRTKDCKIAVDAPQKAIVIAEMIGEMDS